MSSCEPSDQPEAIVDEESALLATTADGTPTAQELPPAKLIAVLLSVWIGVFLAALDGTVISTLLAPISSEFDSFASLSWITTAYLIAQAAIQPLFGKLTDIYGRRKGLLLSNSLFFIGTALCGLARSEYVIIIGRIVAGVGGGGLFAVSSIVATDLVPLRKRGIVQGGGNIAFGSGAALGSLWGGLSADLIGWRWAFILQMPFIVVSSTFVYMFVNVPLRRVDTAPHKRIDYFGALHIVGFLTLFLLALNTGGTVVPWTHPLVLICLPLSFVFLAAFIYTEKHIAKEPIIPLEIIEDRTVAAACLTFLFMVMSVYCAYFFLPIYSMLRGSSNTDAGIHLMPFPIGISVGSLGSGIIMNKTGRYYYLGIATMFLFNLGTGLFCIFNIDTPNAPQYLSLFFFGTGYGGSLTVGLVSLIAAVKHSEQATTTSASYLFRSAGGTIGAAAGAAVFQAVLRNYLVAQLGESEVAREIMERVLRDFKEVLKLEMPWRSLVVDAYMGALRMVFLTAFLMGTFGMLTTVVMREHELHKRLDRK